MIEKPMDVLSQFPVRKTKKQKQAFRDAVQSYTKTLGYDVTVEKGSGAHNIVIGDPVNAKYLVTAHYDTPATMPIPNLITPCNPITFILYQVVFAVFVFAAIGLLMASVEWFVLCFIHLLFSWRLEDFVESLAWGLAITPTLGYLNLLILCILMILGPANKSNANDNTSGVVTVLETAKNLPDHLKSDVCFVLFDLEEVGLVGSAAYRKKHKTETEHQIILNCDCVGDGNELMMFPTKKLKKDEKQMQWFRSACGQSGEKSMDLREHGFAYYPSDQKNFPYGVGIAAFRRSSWAGLYCDKIHTKKDTILEEENVIFLRNCLIKLISSAV